MILKMNAESASYDIVLERGCFEKAKDLLDLDRKVMIVFDANLPIAYLSKLMDACRDGYIYTFSAGEAAKSFEQLEQILRSMLSNNFTRKDCVVALGGGVAGDLAGFAAAVYMRGVDFYNIPTSLLAQVDSSIGGKTGINLNGIKNIVGAFHQPKKVLIDPEFLKTLPARQISNGLAEALKMSLTSDAELFSVFESGDINASIDLIIEKSLSIKRGVVEKDEKESGLRRILNFGHTIGHGVEVNSGLLHGECVALGMLPMCAEKIRKRLLPVYAKLGLPVIVKADPGMILDAVTHDKKAEGNDINAVFVDEIGSFRMEKIPACALLEKIKTITAEGQK